MLQTDYASFERVLLHVLVDGLREYNEKLAKKGAGKANIDLLSCYVAACSINSLYPS